MSKHKQQAETPKETTPEIVTATPDATQAAPNAAPVEGRSLSPENETPAGGKRVKRQAAKRTAGAKASAKGGAHAEPAAQEEKTAGGKTSVPEKPAEPVTAARDTTEPMTEETGGQPFDCKTDEAPGGNAPEVIPAQEPAEEPAGKATEEPGEEEPAAEAASEDESASEDTAEAPSGEAAAAETAADLTPQETEDEQQALATMQKARDDLTRTLTQLAIDRGYSVEEMTRRLAEAADRVMAVQLEARRQEQNRASFVGSMRSSEPPVPPERAAFIRSLWRR